MKPQPSGKHRHLGRTPSRPGRPYGRSLLAATLIIVAGFLAGSNSPAQAAPLDQTCSQNICRKVEWVSGQLRAILTTGQNLGTYHEVCLKRKNANKFTCKFFDFRPAGGSWYSNVSLHVHFANVVSGPGNFVLAWKRLGWPFGGRHLEFSKK